MARLLIVEDDWSNVSRTHRVFGALMGCVLLSRGVLHGRRGLKMTFMRGVDRQVRVFVTRAFSQECAALTLVIRQACGLGKGWKAVTHQEATKKDGWKWGLVLRGQNEPSPPANKCKKILSLNADQFVAWATGEYICSKHRALGLLDHDRR